jgi:hypothetical protein
LGVVGGAVQPDLHPQHDIAFGSGVASNPYTVKCVLLGECGSGRERYQAGHAGYERLHLLSLFAVHWRRVIMGGRVRGERTGHGAQTRPTRTRFEKSAAGGGGGHCLRDAMNLSSWLEHLDWISVRILDLDLAAAGTSLHLVAKSDARFLQRINLSGKISHPQHHSIPSAWFLGFTTRHRTRSGCPRSAQ